jgi:hypothetical protein
MFVWSSVFRFMHHKPKNRRAYVDNKKCPFCEVVKLCNRLHHCVDFTIAFLSSKWSKNIYGTSNLGSRWESYASEKTSVWATSTSGPYFRSETNWRENELPVLLVQDRNFRWLAKEGVVLCENELPVLLVWDRNFRWGPVLPLELD